MFFVINKVITLYVGVGFVIIHAMIERIYNLRLIICINFLFYSIQQQVMFTRVCNIQPVIVRYNDKMWDPQAYIFLMGGSSCVMGVLDPQIPSF